MLSYQLLFLLYFLISSSELFVETVGNSRHPKTLFQWVENKRIDNKGGHKIILVVEVVSWLKNGKKLLVLDDKNKHDSNEY